MLMTLKGMVIDFNKFGKPISIEERNLISQRAIMQLQVFISIQMMLLKLQKNKNHQKEMNLK